jgi:hypothetical protein
VIGGSLFLEVVLCGEIIEFLLVQMLYGYTEHIYHLYIFSRTHIVINAQTLHLSVVYRYSLFIHTAFPRNCTICIPYVLLRNVLTFLRPCLRGCLSLGLFTSA